MATQDMVEHVVVQTDVRYQLISEQNLERRFALMRRGLHDSSSPGTLAAGPRLVRSTVYDMGFATSPSGNVHVYCYYRPRERESVHSMTSAVVACMSTSVPFNMNRRYL